MGRVVVQSYGNGRSKAAKVLAEYLQVKRIKVTGSRFRGKIGDVVVNWGIPRNKLANVRYLNNLDAVSMASNKLKTLQKLKEADVSVPLYVTDADEISWSGKTYARYDLNGHSGVGITVYEDVVPNDAPLYVQNIDKKREYRAIIVGNSVVDFKQKKKRNSIEGEEPIQHDANVWNLNGGYIFARNDIHRPSDIDELAVKATKALGLSYGAVDIIEDNDGKLYVLEINTAFGLEGTTISLVGDAIKALLEA